MRPGLINVPRTRANETDPINVPRTRANETDPINVPRRQANETGLGCAGKVRTAPQLLRVTLFHVATGLPWTWRRDRGDGSERGLLRDLLETLPDRTLLLADAGFVGYAMLGALQAAGHAFVIRVGRHVRLLRKLGFEVEERRGTVVLWPEGRRQERPRVLRLVELQTGARHTGGWHGLAHSPGRGSR